MVAARTNRLEALIGRVVPGASVAEARVAAHAVHALTEGLATMELRGALGPQRTAARTWRAALNALIAGLQADSGVGGTSPKR
jgi:hypothetical protein